MDTDGDFVTFVFYVEYTLDLRAKSEDDDLNGLFSCIILPCSRNPDSSMPISLMDE